METEPLAIQAKRRLLLNRQPRVMLDYALAALYGVQIQALKRAVRRNLDRFPVDFRFEDLLPKTIILLSLDPPRAGSP
jgi:hypothetical protein